jgi:hypothetical protein
MLSLQEIFSKDIARKDTITEIRTSMESSKDKGFFDFYEYNIYGTGIYQNDPLPPSKAAQLKETLSHLTLQQLCERAGYVREFIAKSGTAGMQGAAYLIPDKVHQELFTSAVQTDFCAAISRMMLGPDQIPGASVKIDVIVDESYRPYKTSSGGDAPQMHPTTVQATLAPATFSINFSIGNDLIEDSQFDLVSLFIQEAGREMGEFASNEALTILGTAPDGDGTLNSGTTGDADETLWDGGTTTDIDDAINGITADGMTPTILVTSKNCARHSIINTMGAQYNEAMSQDRFFANGFPTALAGMAVIYSNCDYNTNSKAFTNQITILADKQYGIVTGRKRWLRIENYSEPVMDLVGAVVSARQDSVSLYKDSIFTITET